MRDAFAKRKPVSDAVAACACLISSLQYGTWLWVGITAFCGVLSTYNAYCLVCWDAVLETPDT